MQFRPVGDHGLLPDPTQYKVRSYAPHLTCPLPQSHHYVSTSHRLESISRSFQIGPTPRLSQALKRYERSTELCKELSNQIVIAIVDGA